MPAMSNPEPMSHWRHFFREQAEQLGKRPSQLRMRAWGGRQGCRRGGQVRSATGGRRSRARSGSQNRPPPAAAVAACAGSTGQHRQPCGGSSGSSRRPGSPLAGAVGCQVEAAGASAAAPGAAHDAREAAGHAGALGQAVARRARGARAALVLAVGTVLGLALEAARWCAAAAVAPRAAAAGPRAAVAVVAVLGARLQGGQGRKRAWRQAAVQKPGGRLPAARCRRRERCGHR